MICIALTVFLSFFINKLFSSQDGNSQSVEVMLQFYGEKEHAPTLQFFIDFKDTLEETFSSSPFNSVYYKINELQTTAQLSEQSPSINETENNRDEITQILINLEIIEKEDAGFTFKPKIYITYPIGENGLNLPNSNYGFEKILHKKFFDFPDITSQNLKLFKNNLAGLINYLKNDYEKALASWKNMEFSAALFCSGNAYLKLSLSKDQSITFKKSKIDSAVYFYHKALNKAISPGDSSYVFHNLSLAFQTKGVADSALHYALLANNKPSVVADLSDRMRVINNLGNCYLISGNWAQAIQVFQGTLENARKLNDQNSQAKAFENLGHIYQMIYQKNKSIKFYEQAYEIRKAQNDSEGMSQIIRALGDIYYEKKDYDTARLYFYRGMVINEKIQNETGVALFSDRLGQSYHQLNQADSAAHYLEKSSEIFQLMGNKLAYLKTLIHRAALYQDIRQSDKAISYYEHTLTLAEDIDHLSLSAQILDRLGDIYNTQNKLDQAFEYYQKSANLYQRVESHESLSLILYNMGLIRLKQKELAAGYQLLSQAVQIDENYGYGNLKGEYSFIRRVKNLLDQ